MSFKASQFREVIRCTLSDFDKKLLSDSVIELLMMTAAQESRLGTYLYQDDGDVEIESNLAAGVFQIEPLTYWDIVNRIIIPSYPFFRLQQPTDLITDIKLSILVARFKYWSISEPLPDAKDVDGLARYYKKYYNTIKGKATVPDVIKNYKKYCF